jgi:hypothetical protein
MDGSKAAGPPRRDRVWVTAAIREIAARHGVGAPAAAHQ